MKRIDLRPYRKTVLICVLLVFLHSLRYFDYIGLDVTIYGRITNALSIVLIMLCFITKGPKRIPGQYWLLGLVLVPMLSFLPSWLENAQSPIESFKTYLPTGLVLVYFALHKARVSPNDLIKGITVFALFRILIYVIQQFTFPNYLFAFRQDGMNSLGVYQGIEVRSGIYRYYIEDTYLSMFLVFYYLQRFLKTRKAIDIAFFAIGFIGVYLDQSRQFMVSTLAAVLFVMFLGSQIRYKGRILLGMVIITGIIIANSGELFEDLVYMTQEDLSSDNIRLLSYVTLGLEFWGGPLSVILGNGPIGHSAFGDRVSYLNENLHIYHSDVGLVGAANLYGVVTVLFFLIFFIFFVGKNWRKYQMHLRMYYVAMLVSVPLITIFTQSNNWFVFFSFMMYLTDRDISRYERRFILKRRKSEIQVAHQTGSTPVS